MRTILAVMLRQDAVKEIVKDAIKEAAQKL